MKKNLLYAAAVFMPVVLVSIFIVYISNPYFSVIGIVMSALISFFTYKDIFGQDFSCEDVLEDKDVKDFLKNETAFTEEEYKKISNPDFWLDLCVKLATVNAATRNMVLVQATGLILFFAMSEKSFMDTTLLLTTPICVSCVGSIISNLTFLRKFSKLFKRLAEVATK